MEVGLVAPIPAVVHSPIATPEFWDSWDPIIDRIAGRFRRNRRIDTEDLMQVGRLALLRATARFDPRRGVPLLHYALRSIRNAIYTEAGRSRRRFGDITIEPLWTAHPAGSIMAREMSDAIAAWRATLRPQLSGLFELLYVRGLSQRAAGRELGLVQSRIAQLNRELLDDARAYFATAFDPALN